MKPGDLIWVRSAGRGGGSQMALVLEVGGRWPAGSGRATVRKFRASSQTWSAPTIVQPSAVLQHRDPVRRDDPFVRSALQKLERADIRAMHRADALQNQTALGI